MPTTSSIDICREQYIALRAEICQSIRFQHQILLAGYAAVGASFGYIVTNHIWAALIAIPFALLAMTALWLVEANRMVRASYYIATELWPEMRNSANQVAAPCWEVWIRHAGGEADKFRMIQHAMQGFVAYHFPMILSIASGIAAVYLTYEMPALPRIASLSSNAQYAWALEHLLSLVTAAALVAVFCLWLFLRDRFTTVSNLASVSALHAKKSRIEMA